MHSSPMQGLLLADDDHDDDHGDDDDDDGWSGGCSCSSKGPLPWLPLSH